MRCRDVEGLPGHHIAATIANNSYLLTREPCPKPHAHPLSRRRPHEARARAAASLVRRGDRAVSVRLGVDRRHHRVGSRNRRLAQPRLLPCANSGRAACAARTGSARGGRRSAHSGDVSAARRRAGPHGAADGRAAHESVDRCAVCHRFQPDRRRSRDGRGARATDVGRGVAGAHRPDAVPLQAALHAAFAGRGRLRYRHVAARHRRHRVVLR